MDTKPYVVGVCGGSGSGKTTFCRLILEILGGDRAILISQDNYYKDLSHLSLEARGRVNFDHPDSVAFDLLAEHIAKLSSGQSVNIPQYDFSTHTRAGFEGRMSPKPLVLVEGILIFSDKSLLSHFDRKIFIATQEEVRLKRRIARDIRERGRTRDSVLEQYYGTVGPMHDLFVEPSKFNADDVISGEVPFDLSGLQWISHHYSKIPSI